jgi:hypothetical protein
VLAQAISSALGRSDAKYAVADRFDDTKSEYVGLQLGRLVDINLNSDTVLLRREVAEAQLAKYVRTKKIIVEPSRSTSTFTS